MVEARQFIVGCKARYELEASIGKECIYLFFLNVQWAVSVLT